MYCLMYCLIYCVHCRSQYNAMSRGVTSTCPALLYTSYLINHSSSHYVFIYTTFINSRARLRAHVCIHLHLSIPSPPTARVPRRLTHRGAPPSIAHIACPQPHHTPPHLTFAGPHPAPITPHQQVRPPAPRRAASALTQKPRRTVRARSAPSRAA